LSDAHPALLHLVYTHETAYYWPGHRQTVFCCKSLQSVANHYKVLYWVGQNRRAACEHQQKRSADDHAAARRHIDRCSRFECRKSCMRGFRRPGATTTAPFPRKPSGAPSKVLNGKRRSRTGARFGRKPIARRTPSWPQPNALSAKRRDCKKCSTRRRHV